MNAALDDKSLTPLMRAVIERMVFTQSVALVRIESQWWAAEADLPVSLLPMGRIIMLANSAPRRLRDRLTYDKPVFWTGTVVALVERGVLKFAGPKRVRRGWPPQRPPYTRAVFRYQ
jgi:hypothetical protein